MAAIYQVREPWVPSGWDSPTPMMESIEKKLSSLRSTANVLNCLILFFFKINLCILFIYFWLCWVCCCAWAFSSCSERGLLFVAVCSLLIAVVSVVWGTGSRRAGFSSYGAARELSSCGVWALGHVGFSSCGSQDRKSVV